MTLLSTLQEEEALASAMRFVLAVGRARTLCSALSPEWKGLTDLWDLAEQHHPEEAWWTTTYLGGARPLAELCARAPKNALAFGVARRFRKPNCSFANLEMTVSGPCSHG